MHCAVGYGTLLLRSSIGLTLGAEAVRDRALLPVRVEGYRRLYDYAPPHYRPSRRLFDDGRELAAANVEPCPGAFFTAVAFEVTAEEMEALDRRERGYERVTARLRSFASDRDEGEGVFYLAPGDGPGIERDPGRLLPRWRDLSCARAGSYALGEAFGRAFDRTTFLADGRTPVLAPYGALERELRVADEG